MERREKIMKGNLSLIASAAGVILSILVLLLTLSLGTGTALACIVLFINITAFFASLGSKSLDINTEESK